MQRPFYAIPFYSKRTILSPVKSCFHVKTHVQVPSLITREMWSTLSFNGNSERMFLVFRITLKTHLLFVIRLVIQFFLQWSRLNGQECNEHKQMEECVCFCVSEKSIVCFANFNGSFTRRHGAIKDIGRATSVKPSKTTHFYISVEIENLNV